MGTSTVHRSPRTTRWLLVNSLYGNVDVPVERVLSEVFNAAENEYSSGLADASVLARVEALLQFVRQSQDSIGRDEASGIARIVVQRARLASLEAGAASVFGDMADRAVHTTLLGILNSDSGVRSSSGVLQTFLGNLVATAVDHLVSRDISAHLGSPRLPTATAANALRRDLTTSARSVADQESLRAAIRIASVEPRAGWARTISEAWSEGRSIQSSMAKEAGQ